MRQPALSIWSVSGGQKVSNAHTVVRLVIRIVFRPGRACLNVVNASAKSALQRAPLCTKHGSHCQSGSGLRTWWRHRHLVWVLCSSNGNSASDATRQRSRYYISCVLRWFGLNETGSALSAKWPVEVDETYVGGATQGEGRGRHHKALVIGIVEVLPRKKALGPDPNLPSGQRPQHRGGHGRGFIAGRCASKLSRTASRKRWNRWYWLTYRWARKCGPTGGLATTIWTSWATGTQPCQSEVIKPRRISISRWSTLCSETWMRGSWEYTTELAQHTCRAISTSLCSDLTDDSGQW